jgi:uncharacterized protein (TIGR02466 family)
MLNRELWFPTPIYYGEMDVEGLEDYISNFVVLEKEKNQDNLYSLNVVREPPFQDLVKRLTAEAQQIFDNLYNGRKGSYKMNSLWINISRTGEFHKLHMHPNCDLSGCVYIKTPEDCGNVFFEDPNFLQKINQVEDNNNVINSMNRVSCEHTPTVGKVLFFPSWIRHQVEQNHSDETRISMAFNFQLEFTDKSLFEH